MDLPFWTALPFAAFLLVIAVAPLALPHAWEPNRNKLGAALAFGLPLAAYLAARFPEGTHWLVESAEEYAAFIALLAALYVISGGIFLRGTLVGTAGLNTLLLASGAVLASLIGTTGASMLLIRPLLRANEERRHRVHLVIFFIFVVSNGAGMLTPLGDPPLFLGFLRGVPFLWTLRLLAPWALVNGSLLVIFYGVDSFLGKRQTPPWPHPRRRLEDEAGGPLGLDGAMNLVWLAAVIGVNLAVGYYGRELAWSGSLQKLLLILGMAAAAGLSAALTSGKIRRANRFTWGPILEVAAIFVGIFLTMIPVLRILEARGAALGVEKPWQFFWASGILSSFLDNAPTYLTFASLSVGLVNSLDPAASLSAADLGGLASHPLGSQFLTAVACGAVFMGANTYIGNGPNFMVKSIAESDHVKMPGFFGYMMWSGGILVPLFVLVTVVFF